MRYNDNELYNFINYIYSFLFFLSEQTPYNMKTVAGHNVKRQFFRSYVRTNFFHRLNECIVHKQCPRFM